MSEKGLHVNPRIHVNHTQFRMPGRSMVQRQSFTLHLQHLESYFRQLLPQSMREHPRVMLVFIPLYSKLSFSVDIRGMTRKSQSKTLRQCSDVQRPRCCDGVFTKAWHNSFVEGCGQRISIGSLAWPLSAIAGDARIVLTDTCKRARPEFLPGLSHARVSRCIVTWEQISTIGGASTVCVNRIRRRTLGSRSAHLFCSSPRLPLASLRLLETLHVKQAYVARCTSQTWLKTEANA